MSTVCRGAGQERLARYQPLLRHSRTCISVMEKKAREVRLVRRLFRAMHHRLGMVLWIPRAASRNDMYTEVLRDLACLVTWRRLQKTRPLSAPFLDVKSTFMCSPPLTLFHVCGRVVAVGFLCWHGGRTTMLWHFSSLSPPISSLQLGAR